MHTIDLTGKAAIVTGGTRNIGRAIAQTLAEAGADVALLYRDNHDAARRAQSEIEQSTGRRARVYTVDVRNADALEAAVDRALKVRGIQAARAAGAAGICTDNATTNAGMLAINRALGFVPLPAWIELARVLR